MQFLVRHILKKEMLLSEIMTVKRVFCMSILIWKGKGGQTIILTCFDFILIHVAQNNVCYHQPKLFGLKSKFHWGQATCCSSIRLFYTAVQILLLNQAICTTQCSQCVDLPMLTTTKWSIISHSQNIKSKFRWGQATCCSSIRLFYTAVQILLLNQVSLCQAM